LLEYAVAGQNLERLGTIEVSFNRGVISNIRPMGANNLGGMGATHNADLVGPIGEKARKQKMIGAVTKWVRNWLEALEIKDQQHHSQTWQSGDRRGL
jgi:hypothetical protein